MCRALLYLGQPVLLDRLRQAGFRLPPMAEAGGIGVIPCRPAK